MPSSGRPASGLSMLAALARHALGREQLGRHQPHGVALRLELPCPVVRRPEQASMAITLGGSAAVIAPSLARAPQFDPPLGQRHAVAPKATKLARLPLPSSRQAARSAPSRHAACGAHRCRRRADARLAIQVPPCQCSCGKSCRWHTGRALIRPTTRPQAGRLLESNSIRAPIRFVLQRRSFTGPASRNSRGFEPARCRVRSRGEGWPPFVMRPQPPCVPLRILLPPRAFMRGGDISKS